MCSDYRKGRCLTGPGYSKIIKACNFAKSRGHGFIWIDTCCIDKKSSAELTEAINSMFNWYRKAAECYAYLPDVHSERTETAMAELRRSEWFRRGWTLQELIAPSTVIFCTSSWRVIGDKRSTAHNHGLASIIKKATGVPRVVLRHPDKLWSFSVAERMSWASNRTTSRVEDTAYCLLGLFGVNMPLLYGEGHNAFLRLQREIMGGSLDESILAWSIDSAWCELPVCRRKPGVLSFAVLATSPRPFADAKNVRRWDSTAASPAEPRFIAGPGGLVELRPAGSSNIFRVARDIFLVRLKCYEVEPAPKGQGLESFGQIAFDEFWDIYTIILRQLSCGHYERMFHSGSVSEFYNSGQWSVVEGKTFYMHAVSGKCHYDRSGLAAKKHESNNLTGLARPAINRLNGRSRREARRQRLDQIWSKSMSPTVDDAVPLTPSFTGEAVHDRMHREASTRHLDKIWSKSAWTSTGKT